MVGQLGVADRAGACERHRVIVLHRRAADADGARHFAIRIDDRDAAGEGDEALVRVLDAVERAAGLRQGADLAGLHAEEDGGLGLLLRDVDRADPGAVHAVEGLEVAARIDNRDAHLGAEFDRLGAGRLNRLFRLFDGDVHRVFSLKLIAEPWPQRAVPR